MFNIYIVHAYFTYTKEKEDMKKETFPIFVYQWTFYNELKKIEQSFIQYNASCSAIKFTRGTYAWNELLFSLYNLTFQNYQI